MNYSKIYQTKNDNINVYAYPTYKKITYIANYNCMKVYQYDFPKQKRTLITKYNGYKLIEIPKFSVLLFEHNPALLIMGEIKDNWLVGLDINGYKPWACGLFFEKQNITNPNEYINYLMNLFWLTTFPYYNSAADYGYDLNGKPIQLAIDLNQL